MDAFEYREGCLWAEGARVEDIAREFGDEEETVRLRFVVEPVYPDSEWIEKPTAHDIHVLWQPRAEDSSLRGGFCVERLVYAVE